MFAFVRGKKRKKERNVFVLVEGYREGTNMNFSGHCNGRMLTGVVQMFSVGTVKGSVITPTMLSILWFLCEPIKQ